MAVDALEYDDSTADANPAGLCVFLYISPLFIVFEIYFLVIVNFGSNFNIFILKEF